ncbi:MAG: S1/P1 Nuclease [Hydrotalea flava]|nr:S1/P1 Nuclease [Hydrotalea flava]NIM38220.1 S1/P1 Nuclease [Hydrotalea flava]NIN03384.1 S1/P1 Nuclease [Hydrotalea flava]NIN15078.1 S1/P1 Nuclease [Hydrotalea flava]NIO94146.1 S1/P1 Nuclease [Hydrotalea flava]
MRRKLFFIAILFYVPLTSMAWGMLGHRVVGQIAESYLTPKAAAAIKDILGNETMALASTWADFVRSDHEYDYISPWHYINVADNLTQEELNAYLAQDTIADAYTKINFLANELKRKDLSKDVKKMYVRLLIHIVGDVHQPMHVSREEDAGGNKIKVFWFGQPTNLHSVWDDKLISSEQLSYTEYTNAINYTNKAQRQAWMQQPISQWIYDSYVIAQKLYAEVKAPDQKLSYRYVYDHIQTANEQLLKGGVHLAGLMNQIFG